MCKSVNNEFSERITSTDFFYSNNLELSEKLFLFHLTVFRLKIYTCLQIFFSVSFVHPTALVEFFQNRFFLVFECQNVQEFK